MDNVIITRHVLKHASELPWIDEEPIRGIYSFCARSLQFNMKLMGDTIVCVGKEHFFELGLVHCQTFFDCVDISLLAFSEYRAETQTCLSKFGSSQNLSIIYHFAELPLLFDEYVEKRLPAFPNHFLGQCLEKIPIVNVRKPWIGMKDITVCRRRTSGIVQSLELLSSCHDFISMCVRVFDCLDSLQPCQSTQYGEETNQGFLMPHDIGFDQVFDAVSCYHWAVEFKEDERGGRSIFCSAKRVFKVKSFLTFCESYEWMCSQIYHCIKDREVCRYTPNPITNHSTEEQEGIGLYNFQMPEFPMHENPRENVKLLYQCNLVHGFPHRVFLYFTTAHCERIYGCKLDVFDIEDKQEFEEKAWNVLWLYQEVLPALTISSDDLITMWACKRDALSSVT